ncbi:MAG: molybdopterin-dependent oxidoreductase [Alphaproteobacteria bacterium]|nr:molybdopterin-dependent oxidoreductase [Alphaproteobacteria bacterium]
MMLQLYNNERRLTEPLKRVDGKLPPIAWDQARDEIATKLTALRNRHGPETLAVFSGTRSGIITNNGYVRMFVQLWGTPNHESTEPFCSSSKNLAYALVQGNRLLANSYTPDDIGSAELFLYVGDNQAETRPVYFGMINEWRRKTGARMVAVDPRLSATANKADLWLPIRSGTDMALGLAMIHHIFDNDLHDARFCENWVEGWERWRNFVQAKGYTPAWAEPITDIPRGQIEALAEQVAKADGCMIYASRGVNQHSNGTQTNRVFMFLAAMTGNWGRPGGGYFNISTASFVQANAPADRRAPIEKPGIGRSPAAWLKAMTEGDPYPITALIGANNPFSLWPSQEHVRQATEALDLFVHFALTMNETCELADYVLPIATGIEKGGISRQPEERRIVWSDKFIDPPGEAKTDGWIWTELGKRLGYGDVLTEEHKDIAVFWDAMARDTEALRGAPVARFRSQPNRTVRFPALAEDSPAPETLYLEGTTAFGGAAGNRFPTQSGKLEFWTEEHESAFAAMGLSALPEFYSEQEQLIDLPYVARDGDTGETVLPSLLSERAAYGWPARIVSGSNAPPGAQLRAEGFDTELITGRPPAAHFHSWTHDFWQAQEMWPDPYIQIHPQKAADIGVEDGDRVHVETTDGAIEARAWVREGIRPTAVYVPIGWGEKQPYNPWRPVNYLTDHMQRDPLADQTNLKTRLCKVSRAAR